jgi:hypothetical protein
MRWLDSFEDGVPSIPKFCALIAGTDGCGSIFEYRAMIANIFNPGSMTSGLSVLDSGTLILRSNCPIQISPGGNAGCLTAPGLTNAQTWSLPNATGIIGLTLNKGPAFYQGERGTQGCTTSGGVGSSCDTNVIWTTPFNDQNCTVSCQGTGTVMNLPILGHVTAKSNTHVTVRTLSLSEASSFAAIDCIAVHD